MATTVEELQILLTADASQAEAVLQGIESYVAKFAGKVNQVTEAITKGTKADKNAVYGEAFDGTINRSEILKTQIDLLRRKVTALAEAIKKSDNQQEQFKMLEKLSRTMDTLSAKERALKKEFGDGLPANVDDSLTSAETKLKQATEALERLQSTMRYMQDNGFDTTAINEQITKQTEKVLELKKAWEELDGHSDRNAQHSAQLDENTRKAQEALRLREEAERKREEEQYAKQTHSYDKSLTTPTKATLNSPEYAWVEKDAKERFGALSDAEKQKIERLGKSLRDIKPIIDESRDKLQALLSGSADKADILLARINYLDDVLASLGIKAELASALGDDAQVDKINAKILSLTQSLNTAKEQYKKLAEASQEAGEAQESAVGAIVSKGWSIAKKVIGTVVDVLKKVLSITVQIYSAAARVAATAMSGIAKGFTTAAGAAGQLLGKLGGVVAKLFASPFKAFGDGISKIWKSIESLFGRVRSMFSRLVIRKALNALIDAIGAGFNTLAEHSKEIGETLGQLKGAFTGVGASIATAFTPVILAAAPALMTLANALVTAMNAVSMFFGTLFGTSYTVVSLTGAIDDLGSATSGAGSKAKGALADFDELNVLSKNSGGGGGGGVSTAGFNTSVEDGANSISKLATMLKEGLFEDAGQYINEWVAGLLTSINTKINNTDFASVGRNIARLINGFVADTTTFNTFGATIAKALNGVLTSAQTFAENLNAQDIGDAIAAFINGISIGESTQQLANTIKEFISKECLTAAGLISKTDVDSIVTGVAGAINTLFGDAHFSLVLGETIHDMVKLALKKASLFISSVDFESIGNSVATFLKELKLGDIITELGNAVWSAVTGALTFASTLLTADNVSAIGTEIVNGINNLFSANDSENRFASLGRTLANILNNVIEGLTKTLKATNFADVGSRIAEMLNNLVFNADMGGLAESVKTLIIGACTSFTTFLDDTDFNAIGKKIAEFIGSLTVPDADEKTAAAKIGEVIKKVVLSAIDLLGGLLEGNEEEGNAFSNAITEFLSGIKLTKEEKERVSAIITNAISEAVQIAATVIKSAEFKDAVGVILGAAIDGLWEGLSESFGKGNKVDTWDVDVTVHPTLDVEAIDWFDLLPQIRKDIKEVDIPVVQLSIQTVYEHTGDLDAATSYVLDYYKSHPGTFMADFNAEFAIDQILSAEDHISPETKEYLEELDSKQEVTKLERSIYFDQTGTDPDEMQKAVDTTRDMKGLSAEKSAKRTIDFNKVGNTVATFKSNLETIKTMDGLKASAVVSRTIKAVLDGDLSTNDKFLSSLGIVKKILVKVGLQSDGSTVKVSNIGTTIKMRTNMVEQTAATGGVFDTGTLILAGEAGAEVVGNLPGGKTGVMNVGQMSEAVKQGVFSAMTSQNQLLREQNRLLSALVSKDLVISPSAQLGQVVARSQEMYGRV